MEKQKKEVRASVVKAGPIPAAAAGPSQKRLARAPRRHAPLGRLEALAEARQLRGVDGGREARQHRLLLLPDVVLQLAAQLGDARRKGGVGGGHLF